MDTPRRHSLAVAVRRSERTITKILAAVCTTALLVLYAIIEMSDLLQVPYLGTAVLVVGLVSLLLTVLVGGPGWQERPPGVLHSEDLAEAVGAVRAALAR